MIFTWITRGSFFLLAVLSLADFLRHRNRARLDIALLFNTLNLAFVVQTLYETDLLPAIDWLSIVALMALLAHPYLSLRLVEHFRTVPRPIKLIGLGGMLLSWVLLILFVYTAPGLVILVIVAHFIIADGYATWAFIQGARTTGGVTRQRLRLAAWASGLLGVTMVLSGIQNFLPEISELLVTLIRIGVTGTGVMYYLAFASPRWLRRTWQLSDIYSFLQTGLQLLATQRTDDFLASVCVSATRIVDGSASLMMLWQEAEQQFTAKVADRPELASAVLPLDGPTVKKVWDQKQAAVFQMQQPQGNTTLKRLMMDIGASHVYLVPITSDQQAWGLLIVFLPHGSLFVDEDVALLKLFAGYSALSLEHGQLVTEQRALVAQLQNEVTEHKHAQEQILRLNDVLEQHAVELQNANQELEAFSYSVSHDLRAPLRAADGFSRILLEDYAAELSAEAIRYLNLVRTNTQHMGHLIDELLTFSRLSRQPLNTQPVAPREIVERVLEDLRAVHQDRQIELVIGELPDCEADPGLLQQVYVNLLENAFKFTRQCEVARIEVDAFQQDDETVYFIRDNGVGFDMRYVNKLFGVFQRLHRAEDYEGTGVGLATVQRIIRRHGGRIWAESEVNQGTTFYFTLRGEVADG